MSNEGPTRRDVLINTTAAAVAVGLNPVSALAQPSARSPEKTRQLLAPLITNPEWQIPGNDGSEGAQQFYARMAKFERYYSGERGRGYLYGGVDRLLANGGEHLAMVLSTAKRYGVPKEIVFLGLAESHWSDFGENKALAAGYWQIIPATAKMLGLQNIPTAEDRKDRKQVNFSKEELKIRQDERLDPAKSTDAAMRYLLFLKRFFDKIATNHGIAISPNDAWAFAMWAYNRGPGHVRKTFLETKGNPLLYPKILLDQPIPSKSNRVKVLSARGESAEYVPKIAAIRAQIARLTLESATPPQVKPTPKEAPPPEPQEKETTREIEEEVEQISYKVQGGDNLTKIATWISPDPDFVQLRMDQVRDYNERMLKRKLPDQVNKNERLYIPAQRILVETGDTLDKIAREYCSGWSANVAVNHLRYLNGLRPGMQLQAGKKLIVPLQNN